MKDETKNKAVFESKYKNQVITVESSRFNDPDQKGHRIYFNDGAYVTDDPVEIKVLKQKVRNPKPGCKITLVQDIEDENIDWEEEVKQYHIGGGNYELPNGEKCKGSEKAIEILKEMM